MTAARRLAAILAADVVGYSRLWANEAGTANTVGERAASTPISPSTTAASRQRAARIGCESKDE